MKRRTVTTLSKLALVTAALVWGASFVVIKDTLNNMPVMRIIALRTTIAAVMLFALCARSLSTVTRAQTLGGIITGIALWGGTLMQTYGLTDTTPGKSAFLTASYCVFTPFLAWCLKKERPQGHHFLAAALCLVGVGLIALDARLTVGFGDMITLACGVMFALHIICVDAFAGRGNVFYFVMLQFATSAVLSWLTVWITAEPPIAFSAPVAWKIFYLGAVASFGGMLLQNVAQKNVEPSAASLLCALESVFAVMASVLFYQEKVSFGVGCGFAIVFLAIVVSETKLAFLKPFLQKNSAAADARTLEKGE